DTVGEDTLKRSYGVIKKDGIIVSLVDDRDRAALDAHGIRGASIRSSPKPNVLEELTRLIDAKESYAHHLASRAVIGSGGSARTNRDGSYAWKGCASGC